ncbi:MAG: molybdate ABC transporter substrate-binding protein [bacterium]|nr:molybdate ABC transporter substrate-binding protein [bacterium]
MKRPLWIIACRLCCLVMAGAPLTQAQEPPELIVFAAASLTDAFQEIAEAFSATPAGEGLRIAFNFAGSSDLAAQLSEGAPADVFASANARQMAAAAEAGRIAGEPVIFAQNRLVIIVPADNPGGITTLRDLANAGRQIIIAGEGVPVRDYTETMLERMAADTAYGAAFVEGFRANVVSEEENVRQVAAKIALGEGDAGVVYVSDITQEITDQVMRIDVPDAFNTIAQYPIAVTTEGAQPEAAAAFMAFVLSPEGQAILERYNFIPVCPTTAEAAPDITPAAASQPTPEPDADTTPEPTACPL